MSETSKQTLLQLNGVGKNFGAVQALIDIDFTLKTGQCLGLVGHNGAGKSTLMNILTGTIQPDAGTIRISDQAAQNNHDVQSAQTAGIRCIFQELSLCPNLSVAENTMLMHPSIHGRGWRQRAGSLISTILDEIFPGHGVHHDDIIDDLAIGQRQMVEIARAFTETETRVRLVILDEPTSSLDAVRAGQLLTFVKRKASQGVSSILISHLLGEILNTCDTITVMRDGRITASKPAAAFTHENLVATMGSVANDQTARRSERSFDDQTTIIKFDGNNRFQAHKGEVVGLAGLAGHGQTDLLLKIFETGHRAGQNQIHGKLTLVAGDRQKDGIFPLWSIARNIAIGSLKERLKGWLIDGDAETKLANQWQQRIGIRTPDMNNPILSLSGGNQQKALFARAFASPAPIVLMDDPMRGVDVGTKQEVYAMIKSEAEAGRSFVWYTTEMDELQHCDRVYVFRDGAIVAELKGQDITEERVLQSSFNPSSTSGTTNMSASA